MQWPLPLLSLVLVLVQFILTRLDAAVVKVTSLTAHVDSLSVVPRPTVTTDMDMGGSTPTIHVEGLE